MTTSKDANGGSDANPLADWHPHPRYASLARAVARCSRFVKAWEGDFARATRPRYAAPADIVSGAGARARGGRWHPPNSLRAVYGSLSVELATRELLGSAGTYGFLPDDVIDGLPLYVNAIHARVSRMLDMREGEVRRTVRVSARTMRREPWKSSQNRGIEALTQALGRACWEAGIEGLLVPSAVSARSTNVVFFPDRFRPGSCLRAKGDPDSFQARAGE